MPREPNFTMKKELTGRQAACARCKFRTNNNVSHCKITQPDGEWKQTNPPSETAYQKAVMKERTMEVYWISEDNDMNSLY